jgi:hypothetical protein
MTMLSKRTPRALAAVAALLPAVLSCTSPTAGGSSEQGNARMAAVTGRVELAPAGGKALAGDGIPAAGARVRLLPQGYTPVRDTAFALDSLTAQADSLGSYRIDSVPAGTFVLTVCDSACRLRALHSGVAVDTDDLDLGVDTLLSTGRILANVPDSVAGPGVFVYIPGTEIAREALRGGTLVIDSVPAGLVDVATYSTVLQAPGPEGPTATGVVVEPDSTVVLPGANRPPVISQLPAQMRDTAQVGILYSDTVSASDPDSDAVTYHGLLTPARLVLDSLSGILTWTPGSADTGMATITIEARDTRGGSDTLSWSVTVMAAAHIAPTPGTPVGPVSVRVADSTAAVYLVGAALCSSGDALDYRFAFGTRDTSVWAADTMASYLWGTVGVYSVTAQSRCSVDTTAVSPWSTGLSVTVQ